MAANPIVVIEDGKIEIPEEFQGDPRFKDGARLQLVPLATASYEDSEARARAWEEFRSLRGILAHSDNDPNAELEKEKQKELEAERRWLKS